MTYPYRCTRKSICGRRLTLRKHKELYKKEPKCPSCGWKINHDKTMRKRDKKRTCKCDGIIYPHRKGTEPWCVHAKIGPTDADWEERYRSCSYSL